jgi:N-methylhydantoinase B/oxoprolinase/acetone carboxylase alpha subunit
MNIPVESVEMNFPLRIPRMRLWRGSGGAGRFRGGLSLEKVFEATTTDVTVSHRGERFASSPGPSRAAPRAPAPTPSSCERTAPAKSCPRRR